MKYICMIGIPLLLTGCTFGLSQGTPELSRGACQQNYRSRGNDDCGSNRDREIIVIPISLNDYCY